MDVLVIGANGKIGRKVVERLKNSTHHPVAMIRKKEQSVRFHEQGVDVVLADLEENISHAFKDINAVVFTAGSGGHTGKDKTELVDRMGAIKAIDEAVHHNVKRFIMVSAFGADFKPEEWSEGMAHYYQAKSVADRYLMQTALNYTILKPGRLTDEVSTNKIEIAERTSKRGGKITRGDVAETIVKILEVNAAIGKSLELLQGDTSIEKALSQL